MSQRMVRLLTPFFVGILGTGCAKPSEPIDLRPLQSRLDRIEKHLTEVKDSTAAVGERDIPNPLQYALFDVGRNQQLGYLVSDVPFCAGQRLFLSDDVYEIETIKIYTGKGTPITGSAEMSYRTREGELLLRFKAKAITRRDG